MRRTSFLRIRILTFLVAWILCVDAAPLDHVMKPSKFTFPNGDTIDYMYLNEPARGDDLAYAKAGWVLYETMIFRTSAGGEEVMFRGPSGVGKQVTKGELPAIHAFMDSQRAEVCGIARGSFELFRFERLNGEWRFLGRQENSGFDVFMSGLPPPPMKPQRTSNLSTGAP